MVWKERTGIMAIVTILAFDWIDGGKCRLISVMILGTIAPTRMSDQIMTLLSFIWEMC